MTPQIFGLEFISQPRDPVYYGARGVLSHLHKQGYECMGFNVTDLGQLRLAIKQLRAAKRAKTPLIILSGHGEAGLICLGNRNFKLEELIAMNPGLFKNTWLHLSYCESLSLGKNIRFKLIKEFCLWQLTGFKKTIRWDEGLALDIATAYKYLESLGYCFALLK